jgi:hypothetical protein
MTAKEYQLKYGKQAKRKRQKIEELLQIRCISWFRSEYPQYAMNYFAVGNGGSRNAIEGANLKRAGVLAGVSDTILLVPNPYYHGLCIEFKKDYKSKQTDNQIAFQEAVDKRNYGYSVIHDFEDFKKLIKSYILI